MHDFWRLYALCISAGLSACAAEPPRVDPALPTIGAEFPNPPRTCTADDLSNLAAAARMSLKDLAPEQMVSIAVAIKHAQDDAAALRAAEAKAKEAAAKPKEPAK